MHVAFLEDYHSSPAAEKEQREARYRGITTHGDAKQYMAEVKQKVEPQV